MLFGARDPAAESFPVYYDGNMILNGKKKFMYFKRFPNWNKQTSESFIIKKSFCF